MIEAPHYAADGSKHRASFALPADPFDGTVNEPVLHQAVKVHLANQRQGTHATKTRSFVTGGNQKPWRQKGTGRARQGSNRSPLWPGGGTVFGPHPRDYRQGLPKKVRQLARRSALNARAREGSLAVIDGVDFEAPKTARFAALLSSMGLEGKKVLVLTNGIKRNVYLSGRNLPTALVMPFGDASAYDVLWSETVVVEQGAITGEPAGATEAPDAAAPAPAGRSKPAARRAAPTRKPSAGARSAKKASAPAEPAKAAKPRKPAAPTKKKESK
jgi:large subunit ribosomal protein L4